MDCLCLPVKRGHAEAVTELLLLAGGHGEDPLHAAVSADDLDAVQRMLDVGASVDRQDRYGMTPLNRACAMGLHGVAETLLRAGADVGVPDMDGFNALHTAVREGADGGLPLHTAVTAALLRYAGTFDIQARNGCGDTALRIAARGVDVLLVKRLLEAGANPDCIDGAIADVDDDAATV